MGEHTLAKIEHQMVLARLEAEIDEAQAQRNDDGRRDVYIDTLVNMHRQDIIATVNGRAQLAIKALLG